MVFCTPEEFLNLLPVVIMSFSYEELLIVNIGYWKCQY